MFVDKVVNHLEPYKFNYKINNKGNITFLGYELYEQNISALEFKNLLANTVADIIVEDWVHILMKRIIRDHYYYFNEEEKKNIKSKALELLKSDQLKFRPVTKKDEIAQRVLDYLEKNKELVVEGFVNFRLKDFMMDIEDVVDSAVDDFLMEKEYLEFIRLLKYFVEIQEPKVNEVHIIFIKDGTFKLVDKDGKEIENEYLDGFSLELMNNSINYEDLLISALITLAPRLVVIHKTRSGSKDTVKTIENVFGKKSRRCSGCLICERG